MRTQSQNSKVKSTSEKFVKFSATVHAHDLTRCHLINLCGSQDVPSGGNVAGDLFLQGLNAGEPNLVTILLTKSILTSCS